MNNHQMSTETSTLGLQYQMSSQKAANTAKSKSIFVDFHHLVLFFNHSFNSFAIVKHDLNLDAH